MIEGLLWRGKANGRYRRHFLRHFSYHFDAKTMTSKQNKKYISNLTPTRPKRFV